MASIHAHTPGTCGGEVASMLTCVDPTEGELGREICIISTFSKQKSVILAIILTILPLPFHLLSNIFISNLVTSIFFAVVSLFVCPQNQLWF